MLWRHSKLLEQLRSWKLGWKRLLRQAVEEECWTEANSCVEADVARATISRAK